MYIFINSIGAVLLGLFAVFIFRKRSRAKRINDYFSNAVRVYALTNEEAARAAIVTAAMDAAKAQRHSMVKYLERMVSDLKKMDEIDEKTKPHIDKFIESSLELANEISSRDWNKSDINKQKEELGTLNSDYLAALEKADPTIFSQKHPRLFKKIESE